MSTFNLQLALENVGKRVRILLVNNLEYEGVVYCVDPEIQYFIIFQITADSKLEENSDFLEVLKPVVIFKHAIKTVEYFDDKVKYNINLSSNFLELIGKQKVISNEDKIKRKTTIKSLLEKNQLQVEEKGDNLVIMKVLTIYSPYFSDNCVSDNDIVLRRIKKIIQEIDFEK